MSRTVSRTVALASFVVALRTMSSSAGVSGQIYIGTTPAPGGQWAAQPSTKNGEWPHYTADIRGNRYSPLDQINASNFNKLEIAWRYKTDNLGPRPEYKLEGTPLMVKGVLYMTGGTRRSVIALDAKTGETIWTHSLREGKRAAVSPRQLSGRGVSYWTDGRGDERIVYVTTGYRLVELNAKTGAPVASFGKDGIIDLKLGAVKGKGEQIDLETGEIGVHSTPAIVKDTIIVGSAMREGATVPTHNNTKGLVTSPFVLLCVGTVAPSRIADPTMIVSLTMAGVEWTPISPVSRSICSPLPFTAPSFRSMMPSFPNDATGAPVFAFNSTRRYPVVTY